MHGEASCIKKVAGIMKKATDSTEFEEYCEHFFAKNQIPPKVLDFWFYGQRTSNEDFDVIFIGQCLNRLKQWLAEPKYLQISDELFKEDPTTDEKGNPLPPPKKLWLDKKAFPHIVVPGKKTYSLSTKEAGNSGKFKDYFFGEEETLSITQHALFTQMSFDHVSYHTEGEFALWLATQPPVNNRDFDIARAVHEENSMWHYSTNSPELKNSRDDTMKNSAGQYILASRIRREKFPVSDKAKEKATDQYLKDNLSPYTTMQEIIAHDSFPGLTRDEGIKTLGDHVGMQVTFVEAKELFKILTVRKRNKMIYF